MFQLNLTPSFPVRSGLIGRLLLAIQVLFQDYSGRYSVYAHFGLDIFRFLAAAQFFLVDESSLNFFQQAFSLPAGKSFIHHFHRHANLFPHTLREAFRLLGHFAARAIQPQRQPHDNLPHPVFAHQLTQPSHILVAVDAFYRA